MRFLKQLTEISIFMDSDEPNKKTLLKNDSTKTLETYFIQ